MEHIKTLCSILIVLMVCISIHAQNMVGAVPISYELTFDVPEDPSQPVKGHEVLTFFLEKKQDVILDFFGLLTTEKCTLNKKSVIAQEDGRQIIIPKKRSVAGENRLVLDFTLNNYAFKRSEDYLYTPYSPDRARMMFPCMGSTEQLAKFSISLKLPKGWEAVTSESKEPLKANLVTFTAGRFLKKTAQRNGHDITILYRDDEQNRQAQLADLTDDAAYSINWLEQYTGIVYPFDNLNIVVLPDYQSKRSEHPGAILLNDKTTFLKRLPTQEETQKRLELTAHEVAHLWFGDLVRAEDNDIDLAYELLANYLATRISMPKRPKEERDLAFMRTCLKHAKLADATLATHTISEELDNLDRVGLQYGDIVSDRATVIMEKLTDIIGEERLHKGVQQFLTQYAFGSANWHQFADAIDNSLEGSLNIGPAITSWTTKKGIPTFEVTHENGQLRVKQTGGDGWTQKLDIRLGYDMEPSKTVDVTVSGGTVALNVPNRPNFIIPNYSGMAFGRAKLTREQAMKLTERAVITRHPQNRYALLQTLFDNYRMGISSPYYFGELVRTLEAEKEPFIISELCRYLDRLLRDKSKADRVRMENSLWGTMQGSRIRECHRDVTLMLAGNATCTEVINELYNTWKNQSDRMLTERDYMSLAYRLAILRPQEWQSIINTQRKRLSSDELRSEFDFISHACSADEATRKELFLKLLKPQGRTHEAWAEEALSLLNCTLREPANNEYIRPALEAVEDIQLTSTSTFPQKWLNALLQGHHSQEARHQVEAYLASRPDYPLLLKNKILEAASELLTEHSGK